ncbi:Zinc finger protein ZAT9 [Camellia lanceoleosa]|uniref:Zinc finger protein ZAT9 n=1 Tax=Camellia lanceoleosa TaxID=1840588 RepID=A0ACC0HHL2_9ERIC|nr:Zinc finger protein ZAT9 [Camellia lanceoleosa]
MNRNNSYLDRHHRYNQTSKELESKKPKLGQSCKPESPMSSISETSPEEELTYCLLMLSRDKWILRNEEKDEEENEQTKYDSDEFKKQSNKTRIRKKYKYETFHRVF